MVREREESLREARFPKDEEIEEMEPIVIPDESPEETFSTGDVNLGGQMEDETAEDQQEAVNDVDDEFTSFAVNHERMKVDLADYQENPAFSSDPNHRISRYVLFKLADYVVNAYPAWYRFMFMQTDESRVKSLREGIRHDITGDGHKVLTGNPGVGGFDMTNGVPKTVDDDSAREHYQAKHEAGRSKYDGEEMLRRYRFSVVISKMLEALYRRGYDVDEDFKGKVKTCNSVSEDPSSETTTSRRIVLQAIGTVEKAMGEANRIAFKAESYSFFSEARSLDHYAFTLKDLQSYIASKSRGKITGELAHLMHYYDVDPVPSFKALASVKEQPGSKPVQLKFLSDTPLQLHRGANMLMPAEPINRIDAPADASMDVVVEEEEAVAMEVEEVSEFATPEPPPPPTEPIIEDDDDEEMEQATGKDEKPSERITEIVPDVKEEDEPSTGYAGTSAKGPPVVLTPARPDTSQTEPHKFMPTRPKAMPKAPADPKAMPRSAVEPTPEKSKEPEMNKDVKKEVESTATNTKMTSEVKQIPKAKARPQEATSASSSKPEPASVAGTSAPYTATSTEANASVPINQNESTGGDLWANFRGTGRDVRDDPNDPQYVESGGGVRRIPSPPRPSREGGETSTARDDNTNVEGGGGRGQPKGRWRPVLDLQNDPQSSGKGGSRSSLNHLPLMEKGRRRDAPKERGRKEKEERTRTSGCILKNTSLPTSTVALKPPDQISSGIILKNMIDS